jgi:nuclease YhcG-like protein
MNLPDDLLRTSPDAPTLGLLLCESRGESIIAEYALRDIAKPIGVSTYRDTRLLPEPLRDEVPSIEDLKQVLEKPRPEISELQAEQHADYPNSRKSTGKSVRK